MISPLEQAHEANSHFQSDLAARFAIFLICFWDEARIEPQP